MYDHNMEIKERVVDAVRAMMVDGIEKRFSDWLITSNLFKHNKNNYLFVYALATLLDPRFKDRISTKSGNL